VHVTKWTGRQTKGAIPLVRSECYEIWFGIQRPLPSPNKTELKMVRYIEAMSANIEPILIDVAGVLTDED
jgi:hypothetical protein